MILKRLFVLAPSLLSLLYGGSYEVTLKQAVDIALLNNKNIHIAQTSVEIAQTKYNQAMSGHYPQLNLEVMGTHVDEAPTFEMIGSTTIDNRQTITMYNGLSSAAAADGDVYSSAAYANLAANTPAQTQLPIDMDVKIMGQETIVSRLNLMLPLYTGGKVSALIKQAKLAKEIEKKQK